MFTYVDLEGSFSSGFGESRIFGGKQDLIGLKIILKFNYVYIPERQPQNKKKFFTSKICV